MGTYLLAVARFMGGQLWAFPVQQKVSTILPQGRHGIQTKHGKQTTMPLSTIHQGNGDINNHIISLFKDPLDTKHVTYKDDTLTEDVHGFHGILNWFPAPLP